jgi:hypothetical protein
MTRHQQDWERLAEVDPLWAVLTAPDRKGGGWNEADFFATGEDEVAAVLGNAERLGSSTSAAASGG